MQETVWASRRAAKRAPIVQEHDTTRATGYGVTLIGAAARFGCDQQAFTPHAPRTGGASDTQYDDFGVEETQRLGRTSDVWKLHTQGNPNGAAEITRRMMENSTIPHERLKTGKA